MKKIIVSLIFIITVLYIILPREKAVARSVIVQEVLAAHNKYREALGIPPLRWSARLAQGAQKWANYLARIGRMRHSRSYQRSGQGENLWMGTSGYFSYTRMVDGWGSEKQYFRYGTFPNVSTTGNWAQVGHYTQMIWKTTTHVGCGVSRSGGYDFFVCRYSPPGNYLGRKVY